jgi:hypothetical protein
MKTKYRLLVSIAVLTFISLACSLVSLPNFQKIETGSTQTLTLNESHPGTDQVQDVSLSMTTGKLTLSSGAKTLLEGEIRYNVEEWSPIITNSGKALSVSQGETNYTTNGFPGEDVVNVWNIKLGNTPMNLVVEASVYEAVLDLSGIPLQNLTVQDGASNSEVRFDTLNPEEMDSLAYQTGASEITFLGLANANFAQMSFEGGAGDYVFDFSGDLQRDADVNIQVGLSNVKIVMPTGSSAQVLVDGGLGNVNIDDAWHRNGSRYVNEGDGPQFTIVVEMGTGSLQLTND